MCYCQKHTSTIDHTVLVEPAYLDSHQFLPQPKRPLPPVVHSAVRLRSVPAPYNHRSHRQSPYVKFPARYYPDNDRRSIFFSHPWIVLQENKLPNTLRHSNAKTENILVPYECLYPIFPFAARTPGTVLPSFLLLPTDIPSLLQKIHRHTQSSYFSNTHHRLHHPPCSSCNKQLPQFHKITPFPKATSHFLCLIHATTHQESPDTDKFYLFRTLFVSKTVVP